MREAIARRGRDDAGMFLREHVGFSHARLSIRDLSLGRQPIVRQRDGREYAIVYNGEIYNAEELQAELVAAGYVFETTTDTEVILYGYMHGGLNFVKRLNGIFAFAIWDGGEQRMVLYRDRLGVKPLFYSRKNDVLVFGSEIKALFCHPALKPQLGMDSFRRFSESDRQGPPAAVCSAESKSCSRDTMPCFPGTACGMYAIGNWKRGAHGQL
jgi:asparagine synthase (glutamine-hydrolysing)